MSAEIDIKSVEAYKEKQRDGAVRRGLSLILALLFFVGLMFSNSGTVSAQAKKYKTWREIADAMTTVLTEAKELYNDDVQAAAEKVNDAYFSYYERLGFEKNAANFVGGKRKILNENAKRNARRIALANGAYDDFAKEVDNWIFLLQVDARVLDGTADSVESAEAMVSSGTDEVSAEAQAADTALATDDSSAKQWSNFVVAYGLTMREGLEAILVIVAILAYLAKSGEQRLNKAVYGGMAGGVLISILLAVLLNVLRQAVGESGVGQSQEIFEGVTMLLAVVVLFFVSNWLLAKSDVAAWHALLQKQVATAIGTGSILALVFSSFLAVAREGAELILFFQVLLTGDLNKDFGVWAGLLAGVLCLAAVWVLFRIYAVKLPLKPFFYFTSVLMFVLCFSFTGKGVMELIEGNVIISNDITFLNNFTFDFLGIYPYYETLVPQLLILLLTALLFVRHFMLIRKRRAQMEKVKAGSSALLKVEELQEALERKDKERLRLQAEQINAYLTAYQAAKNAGDEAAMTEYKTALLAFEQDAMELSRTLPCKVKLDSVSW